ncbi:hypothetical protein [Alicyclobacillus acidiphilus]|uniref:hypothetical protein n=1 Tax=Alicyclobacillus acidiphilus TaxID=182455 RepID=UPI0008322A0B|nr:hypothetical protein [Alicyclobacillus acidiphilus]
MKHAVWIGSLICGLYGMFTSIWLARYGVTNQISQLVAAGGAESLAGLLCMVSGLLVLWRAWPAIGGFLLNLVWCSAIAAAYGDLTVWAWCAVNALFAVLSFVVGRRRTMRRRNPASELSPS